MRIVQLITCLVIMSLAALVTSKKPNIMFIMTDDQDIEMNSASYMPKLQSYIIDKGATFTNAYANTPLCCPSRSSFLTGTYVHNHGVLNNSISGGCSSLQWQAGPEQQSIGALLKNAGYVTHFAGKYLNNYGLNEVGGLSHVPPGWDFWTALQGNAVYYNYTLSVNGVGVWHGDNPDKDYFTNVIKNTTIDYINQVSVDQPFFMMIAPTAPHQPYTPEPKYENSLTMLEIPRTPNFNIANVNKHWLVQTGNQPLQEDTIGKLDEIYRNRLRTLLSVDDMIEDIISALEARNLLNDTYIIYSSDHGYHCGQYSYAYDKREPYETDIKVPLFIRGPVIRGNTNIPVITVNIDLTATILDLAGATIPSYFDGTSLSHLLVLSENSTYPSLTRTILIEHHGEYNDLPSSGCEYVGFGFATCDPEMECKCSDSYNNTYNCIRTLGNNINNKYCKWDDSEQFVEYYDLLIDPFEITNSIYSVSSEIKDNLQFLLDYMASCQGINCTTIMQFDWA